MHRSGPSRKIQAQKKMMSHVSKSGPLPYSSGLPHERPLVSGKNKSGEPVREVQLICPLPSEQTGLYDGGRAGSLALLLPHSPAHRAHPRKEEWSLDQGTPPGPEHKPSPPLRCPQLRTASRAGMEFIRPVTLPHIKRHCLCSYGIFFFNLLLSPLAGA